MHPTSHEPTIDEKRDYAERYLRKRIETFRKDISICLTPDARGRHAYIPALPTCTAFLELLSCLYKGNLKREGNESIRVRINRYAQDFMDRAVYTDHKIFLLYELFRHKTAHTMQPYGVFDTERGNKTGKEDKYKNEFPDQPHMRVTWEISESDRKPRPPIDLIEDEGALTYHPPWTTPYDHRCVVSLRQLSVDIAASVLRKRGYLAKLKSPDGNEALRRFFACIDEIFPMPVGKED